MDVSVGCNICKVCVRYIGNTTDIKLADRFSRAVIFFFFDKVTQLAGWQVVFFFEI